jgi:hypothetical protein
VSRYDLDHVAADELETILRRQASQSRIRPTRDAGE